MQTDANKLQRWRTLAKAVAFETPWFKIYKQHMRTPAGVELDYYVHDGNDSVICVCVSDDGRLLVERQYRPPIQKVSIDYPAGRMEKDDATTEAAIRRELQEEAGYTAHTIKKLAVLDKEPGFSRSRMHVFLAHGVIDQAVTPDETESIVIDFLKPDEVLNMITSSQMTCTFCVSATLLAFKELGWLGFEGH